MKKLKYNILNMPVKLVLFLCFAWLAASAQTAPEAKRGFLNAKSEIGNMLDGNASPDFERAVFIAENPDGNADHYKAFQKSISLYLDNVKAIAGAVAMTNAVAPKPNRLMNADSARKNTAAVISNYAIYRYITDTAYFIFDSVLYCHLPFRYSFSDPFATRQWQHAQVSSLLKNEKNDGNCNALVLLFKIFSERLNSGAMLCTAPNHVFIRHADENGIVYNVELASRSFPGTGSIETISYTTDEAARKGIAMRELDLKQSIALQLVNLAKNYEHSFGTKTDDFILSCAELCLKYDAMNLNAMLLKADYYNAKITQLHQPAQQLQTNADFIAYQKQITQLYQLGYREMPADMKNKIIAAMMKDSAYAGIFKDQTYTPFPNEKDYDRAFSLSGGLFEEVNVYKSREQYFNTVYDTKLNKIINFNEVKPTYNNYEIDPVVFALSVDPLTKRFPELTPYQFSSNNPVWLIDLDGLEGIQYLEHTQMKNGTTTTKRVIEVDIYVATSKNAQSVHYKSADVASIKGNLDAEYNNKGFKDASGNDVEFRFNMHEFDADQTTPDTKVKQLKYDPNNYEKAVVGNMNARRGFVMLRGAVSKPTAEGETGQAKTTISPNAGDPAHTQAHETAHEFMTYDPKNNPTTSADHNQAGGIFTYKAVDPGGNVVRQTQPVDQSNVNAILNSVPVVKDRNAIQK